MSKPNKTVASFNAKKSRPTDFAKMEREAESCPMRKDMAAFQCGDMSAEDFMKKWQ